MSIARSTLLATVGSIVPPFLALATQPFLAYSLGVVGRGEVAAAMAPLMLATAILTFGLPEGLTHFVARFGARMTQISRLFVLGIAIVGLLGCGLISLASPMLSVGDPTVGYLISIAGLALAPALILTCVRGVAAGLGCWSLVATERVGSAAVRLIGVASLSLAGMLTPVAATIVMAMSTFVGGLAYLALLGRPARAIHDVEGTPSISAVGRYGLRLWIGSIAGILLIRVDQVLMVPLAGAAALGLYAVAVTVGEAVLVLNAGLRDVIFSVESGSRSEWRVTFASRLSTALTLAAGSLALLVAPALIPVVFGDAFSAATSAAVVLIVAAMLGNPGSVAGAALSGWGRPGLRSLSLVVALAVNLALLVVLAPPLGALGAAVATLGGSLVSSNLNILAMRVAFGVPIGKFYLPQPGDVARCKQLLARLRRGRPEAEV